jgi:hypothetical protein
VTIGGWGRQLEVGARCCVVGVGRCPRLGLRGGNVRDMVDASGSTSSPSPLGPYLLLAFSSKHMRGGTLVRIAFELRSSFGSVCLVRDAVLKPLFAAR